MAILSFLRVFCYRIYPGKLAFMRGLGVLQGRLNNAADPESKRIGRRLVRKTHLSVHKLGAFRYFYLTKQPNPWTLRSSMAPKVDLLQVPPTFELLHRANVSEQDGPAPTAPRVWRAATIVAAPSHSPATIPAAVMALDPPPTNQRFQPTPASHAVRAS